MNRATTCLAARGLRFFGVRHVTVNTEGVSPFKEWFSRPQSRIAPTASPEPFQDTTAQALYKKMIDSVISPALREAGFNGSGGRYALRSDTDWALIGFQKSVSSDANRVRFTLNLLAVDKATWEVRRAGRPRPPRPTANTFWGSDIPQLRIGQLSHGGDKWWAIETQADVHAVAADVLDQIERFALPWIREHIAEHG